MKINHHLRTLGADIIGELDEDSGLALFRGIPYASVGKLSATGEDGNVIKRLDSRP